MADPTPENYDLFPILHDWPFEPGTINVRVIQGLDQLPKIQVRLDLGIIQMNIDGRPDGQRPHGFSSLLEYLEARLDEGEYRPSDEPFDPANPETAPEDTLDAGVDAEAGNADPTAPPTEGEADGDFEGHFDGDDPPPFSTSDQPGDAESPVISLDADTCRALREEAAQYYHRYVALLVLEDFEGVIRDTSRNLRVADLCREYAEDDRDRAMLEQVRPYIIMMRTRAIAGQALKDDIPKAAIAAVDDGLDALRTHYAQIDEPEEFEQSSEAQSLRQMRDALIPKLPVSQKTELRERLHEAIRKENYELAAILRNELRMLGD